MLSKWFGSLVYTEIARDVFVDASLEKEDVLDSRKTRRSHVLIFATFVFLVAIAGATGFLIGTRTSHSELRLERFPDTVPQVPIGWSKVTFQYNSSFAAAPPKAGGPEPIWDSMIPNGLSYIEDTRVAAEVSVLSVFHQLHCLYTVRRAYYSGADEGNLEDFDLGKERKPHIAHCFDYLRQSLLCSADSSIEPGVDTVNGFLGSGFLRKCRDFGELREWAQQRRAFEAQGFLVATDEEA